MPAPAAWATKSLSEPAMTCHSSQLQPFRCPHHCTLRLALGLSDVSSAPQRVMKEVSKSRTHMLEYSQLCKGTAEEGRGKVQNSTRESTELRVTKISVFPQTTTESSKHSFVRPSQSFSSLEPKPFGIVAFDNASCLFGLHRARVV